MSERGRFISFEGGEGAGKTTQISRLAERLRATGKTVTITREPGGAPGAEAVRDMLVDGPVERWTPMSEALLIYAARADHLARTIEPARARGEVVLSDRFSDSSMAYQGYAGGVGRETIAALDRLVVGSLGPDLTIMLDIPVETGLARASARGGSDDRFERKGREFHDSVRAAFLDIARKAPDRCVVINADRDVDTLAKAVAEVVRARLGIG